MSITDELRGFMAGADGYELWCPRHKNELTAIADRIDAEHAKAIRELNNLADASVLLPRDADGVLIRVGDVLDGYGKTIEIVEMRHGRSGWVLISRDGNGYADTFAFVHHHAPTVEDVLEELLREYDRDDSELTNGEIIEMYAQRLQLREVDE